LDPAFTLAIRKAVKKASKPVKIRFDLCLNEAWDEMFQVETLGKL
jgi:hypothetical protein